MCTQIVHIELESKGKKATVANLKFCTFRKKLLDHCRDCFEEIFQQDEFEALKKKADDAGKEYTMEDHKENLLKRQHKLFGNIEFIGELYKCHLLRGDTAKSIFVHLLDEDCFLDDTVEAAIKFIEKIGLSIEEKLKTQNASSGGGGADNKRKFTDEEYQGILQRFEKIWKSSEKAAQGTRIVSVRLQKLI